MADTAMELNWDDPNNAIEEGVTESDVKNAESSGKPPIGKYLCQCAESRLVQSDMKAYSCLAANLKWEIERPLEIESKPVKGGDYDELIGKAIFDKVNLPHPSEKDGMKNRRVLMAKRVGLIPPTGGKLTNRSWGYDIIGKRAILDFIEEEYTDRAGVKKTSRKVAFNGYNYADAATTVVTNDDFADI